MDLIWQNYWKRKSRTKVSDSCGCLTLFLTGLRTDFTIHSPSTFLSCSSVESAFEEVPFLLWVDSLSRSTRRSLRSSGSSDFVHLLQASEEFTSPRQRKHRFSVELLGRRASTFNLFKRSFFKLASRLSSASTWFSFGSWHENPSFQTLGLFRQKSQKSHNESHTWRPKGRSHNSSISCLYSFWRSPLKRKFYQVPIGSLSFKPSFESQSSFMTSGMLLLVAYDFSSDEVATASVIDARGQGYDLHVWNRKDSLRDDLVELWKLALGFARRANILWRIVISSIDGLDEREPWRE